MKSREIQLKSRPSGLPSKDNFKLVEKDAPSAGDGQILVRNEWMSVDPYMRGRMREGKSYIAPFEIGKLAEGESVFVSAASGAVGSIVCQIAKAEKCSVIGSAGSEEKINWLKETAGIDAAFNYHAVDDLSSKLAERCPRGIDLYFDNVGGDHLEAAIDQMNDFGRIVCCGMISTYNDETPRPGPRNLFKIIAKRLRMEGFIVRDHLEMQEEFRRAMSDWIRAGKIVWEETITEGLENAPQAFIDLFRGEKMGKAVVKI